MDPHSWGGNFRPLTYESWPLEKFFYHRFDSRCTLRAPCSDPKEIYPREFVWPLFQWPTDASSDHGLRERFHFNILGTLQQSRLGCTLKKACGIHLLFCNNNWDPTTLVASEKGSLPYTDRYHHKNIDSLCAQVAHIYRLKIANLNVLAFIAVSKQFDKTDTHR